MVLRAQENSYGEAAAKGSEVTFCCDAENPFRHHRIAFELESMLSLPPAKARRNGKTHVQCLETRTGPTKSVNGFQSQRGRKEIVSRNSGTQNMQFRVHCGIFQSLIVNARIE